MRRHPIKGKRQAVQILQGIPLPGNLTPNRLDAVNRISDNPIAMKDLADFVRILGNDVGAVERLFLVLKRSPNVKFTKDVFIASKNGRKTSEFVRWMISAQVQKNTPDALDQIRKAFLSIFEMDNPTTNTQKRINDLMCQCTDPAFRQDVEDGIGQMIELF